MKATQLRSFADGQSIDGRLCCKAEFSLGRSGLVGVQPNRVNRRPASLGWSGWSANGRDMLVSIESIDSDKVYRQSVRFDESDRAPTAQ